MATDVHVVAVFEFPGEIAPAPAQFVTTIKDRDVFATDMACSSCSLDKFPSPCVQLGTCEWEMDWWLFAVCVEGAAVAVLAFILARGWWRQRAAKQSLAAVPVNAYQQLPAV